MTQAFTITAKEAIPLMLAAYESQELSAQRGATLCSYRSPQGPCIVGAVLPDEIAARWDEINGGGGLSLESVVINESIIPQAIRDEARATFGADLEFFAGVQSDHDAMLSALRDANEATRENMGEYAMESREMNLAKAREAEDRLRVRLGLAPLNP